MGTRFNGPPRPVIISLLAFGILFFETCRGMEAAEPPRPNILFILADDVGSEVLQCYGGESYATPRLDRLAGEGMRFEHAYVMPACHPTRICLLTGQYPFRLGNPDWGTFPAAAESRTIAQVLKRAGYATAIAGKWQIALLGDDPTHPARLGFDESCLFGWHEGPRYYRPHIYENGQLRRDARDQYGPDVYCDFLIDFMKRKRDGPFFAYYSMALCHAVTNDLDEPVPVGPNGRYQTFAEMVAAMDQRVGRLLDALDQLNLRENTLVAFLSDNGSPAKNIDGVDGAELVYTPVTSRRNGVEVPGGKATLTDAGTRVPLIVRWPGAVERRRVTDALVDVSDFLPTLADVADANLSDNVILDGKSFADVLRGRGSAGRDWVFVEFKGQAFVKDRRWKLYRDERLFDLQVDPNESAPVDLTVESDGAVTARSKLQRALDSIGLTSIHP